MNQETLRQRAWEFECEVLHALEKLRMIASGEIKRGRRVSTYDAEEGNRPMRMADARAIAKLEAERLNAAVNKFRDSDPKPWEWDAYLLPLIVHLEPADMHDAPAENCVDCRTPTRYWLPDCHTPLCPDCCARRNQKTA